MDKNLMNISKIESFLNTLLDNKVSDNTFFTSLPPTIKTEWQDMVVVDCGTAISDLDAMGKGRVSIFLYAKPLSNGAKNVAKLSELEQKLTACIESNQNKTYVINRAETYTDYDENRNLHCNIIQINIKVF